MNTHTKVVCTISLFCAYFFSWGQPSVSAPGEIDARQWNFSENRLPLNGLWKFHDSKLLPPNECLQSRGTHVQVPIVWNDVRSSGSGVGYATYCLSVVGPATQRDWAIDIPQLYNSYSLWVNGKLMAQNGRVGVNKDEAIPQWKPQVVTFESEKDTIEMVLQISNFHHHKGGIREPIYLGSPKVMLRHHSVAFGSVMFEAVLLFAEALFFLIFFLIRFDKTILVYFALLCLTWALRVLFSNLYPITHFYPDFNWDIMVKIEYTTLYLTMIFATLFLNRLCKEVSSELFKYLIMTINFLFLVFTVFTDPIIFTRWLELYLAAAVAIMIYALIVITRAFMLEKSGLWFLMISLILGVLLMGYDVIAYEGVLINNVLITSIGYIVIFTCITIGLLSHLGIVKNSHSATTTLKYSDLYETKNGKDK